ncbi:hypothetical protein [Actinacidiphila glaucinigra]|uniref:hypothetical protein n=1 Tax=Actinacidiphila glaucinigra TaxID=235986 RepID=UPI00366A879F
MNAPSKVAPESPAGLAYGSAQWEEAYHQADEAAWCETDSRENGGELASVVAGLRDDEAGSDEGLLFAAITVAGGLAEEFDCAFLTAVLKCYDEQASTSLATRAASYVMKRWPDFPLQEIRDPEWFAIRHALEDDERSATDPATDLPYVFNIKALVQAHNG